MLQARQQDIATRQAVAEAEVALWQARLAVVVEIRNTTNSIADIGGEYEDIIVVDEDDMNPIEPQLISNDMDDDPK